MVHCTKKHTELKMMTNATMNFRHNAQKIMLKRDDTARFQVLRVVLLKIQVFWDVMP
jgi:hypothetical protein